MAANSVEELMYLHGDLELDVFEARGLPNMDFAAERLRLCFSCGTSRNPDSDTDNVGGEIPAPASEKTHRRGVINTDPYVTVSAPQTALARTRIIPDSQNPEWNEHFHIPLAHPMRFLEFRVKDDDLFGAQIIGIVEIPAKDIATGNTIIGWYPLNCATRKTPKHEAALRIGLKFTPFESNPLYKSGVKDDPQHLGVSHTYFPLRKGCSVKLYQDAHVRDNDLKQPDIRLESGIVYERGTCWEDICHAISEAHHLVYIVGWSVYHKIKLIREPTRELPAGGDLTLGELLKYKSQEGVRVLLLVWDDKTSHNKLFIKTEGVMGTHDEDTRKFFKNSSVTCVLSPRYASNKLSFIKQQIVGTMFTHHQKCVIVDTHAGGNRKLTAFLGGLDLCDGRYDTPEHRLTHDLDTVFENDIHQPTFPQGTKAPREPWHDLHCRIDGPAAHDVLINFAQRWRRATRWREFAFLKKGKSEWSDDAMIKIERISWILSPADFVLENRRTNIPEDDPRLYVNQDQFKQWHAQIFRSIDSGSVKGFPTKIDLAVKQNLVCGKKLVVDKSIETAYIQAIRSAQKFIYIENQYFLGSSYAWPSYKDAGADHLILMELALKVVSKIRAKERFSIYIVVPMWPEGDPKTATVQEILFWQNQTVQMMYQVISKEIKTMELDAHPLDYLNFYCLGTRESVLPSSARQATGDKDKVSDSLKFMRFMIYVHAKGMIVDDEYVILGSANINQRSMAGSKDTEIAMGAYQPYHTWAARHHHPWGQVYGYRMSLWKEHLGMLEECFEEPEKLECVKRVNEIAGENWKKYTEESFTIPLQGHLLKYPIHVDRDGKVSSLSGYEEFPDVGGKVIGAYNISIPDVLTT